jgi:hypothetical protein
VRDAANNTNHESDNGQAKTEWPPRKQSPQIVMEVHK